MIWYLFLVDLSQSKKRSEIKSNLSNEGFRVDECCKLFSPKKPPEKNGGLPDDTEEGEMASALLGGVGVLVFTCWPVEVEFG